MSTRFARLTILAALLCAPLSAFAELEFNTAVTYVGSDGTRRIHNFAIGNGLVENYFNGSTWQWISHPAPSDDFAALFSARAITYEEDGSQRIYVFAITSNGHDFVVRYWNGAQWQWAKLPTASFLRREKIDVVTYLDGLGKRRIYLFGVNDATEASMVSTWWDGSTWQTANFNPPGRNNRVDGQPTAVTYADGGSRRIHVYCTVNEFGSVAPRLHSLTWNGSSWVWVDLGAQHFRPRSAVTYLDANNSRRIQVFGARELNDSLAVYEWNGSSWSLNDLGKPEFHDYGPPDVSAITYTSSAGGRQIFVATTFNDHLYFKRHDGANWSSFASFAGNAMQFADDPAWTYHVDPRSGSDILNLFVSSASGLMRHRWNGVSWTSFDNGSP